MLLCGPFVRISSDFNLDTALTLAILITIWSVISSKKTRLDTPVIIAISMLLVYILFVSIPIHILFSKDQLPLNEILKPIRIYLYATAACYIVNWFQKEEGIDAFSLISKSIFYSITINSIFIILETLLPDFRLFLFQHFKGGMDMSEQVAQRAGGLLLSGGAIASGFSGFGVLFGFVLLLNPHNRYSILITIFLLLNLIAAILSGRTGILVSIISAIYFLFKTKKKLKFILVLSIGFVFIGFVFLQLISSELFQENQNLYISLSRFAIFLNVYFGSNFETSFTIDERIEEFLFGSFILPPGIIQSLFGYISYSNWNLNYKISDMGFQIGLFKFGFLGICFYYLVYIVSFWKILLSKRMNYLAVLVFAILFLLELKEATMYARGLIALMFLSYYSAIETKNIKL